MHMGHHYRLQLNLYKHLLQTLYGCTVSHMMVVGCHPQLDEPFVDVVPDMPDEVQVLLARQEAKVRASEEAVVHQPASATPSRRCQVVEVRVPNQPRRLVSCPLEDAALNMYRYVSSHHGLPAGTFAIYLGGEPVSADWRPRRRVTLRVVLRQNTRGAIGRCMMIKGGLSRKRPVEADDYADEEPPSKRRRVARLVRVLLDSGADAHICAPSFPLGSLTDETDGVEGDMVDAQGSPIASTGVRLVRTTINDQDMRLRMRECPSTETPILSLGLLLRSGLSFYSVDAGTGGADGRGVVVAGLRHAAGWIPVYDEDDHMWVYFVGRRHLPDVAAASFPIGGSMRRLSLGRPDTVGLRLRYTSLSSRIPTARTHRREYP